MNDLTVWSVCVGNKYHPGYVYALRDAIAKYLTVPHDFKCITPMRLEGIQTVKPFVPYQGWWSKLNLFTPRTAHGRNLYFDLDVVICDNLNYLVDYSDGKLAAPANWAQSGWGGIQSSVMAWRGGWTLPFDMIRPLWPSRTVDEAGYTYLAGKKYWGDQEFLWELLGDDWIRLPGICSYKYHCRQGRIPAKSSVIVFHGEPKPIEVNDPWILPFTSTLRRHIKGSMANGLGRDSKPLGSAFG